MTVINLAAKRPSVSDAEWQTRVDLAAAYRLVARFGMDDSIYTHISARVPGEDNQFLLNAFGLRFEETTASSLVKIDLDGKVLEDPLGLGINLAGYTIHSAVHAVRHDVDCVLHTHTKEGIAVSCLSEGLLPLYQSGLQFHGQLAYHDYEGIALDLDECQRIQEDLGDKSAMILRNHGLLTVGSTVGEAFRLMVRLNQACEIQMMVMSSGGTIHYPADAVIEKTTGQFDKFREFMKSNNNGDIEWAAFLRLLDREDPSYKD